MYQFTDDCLIGIPEIDSEHRKLFEIINTAFATLSQKQDNTCDIIKALATDLTEYATTHFAHEEAYMAKINDPELERQKREHAAFAAKWASYDLDSLAEEAAYDTLNEILTYLTHWLYRHILSSDMIIGKIPARTPAEPVKEDPFAFTAKYHTGIELVDNEHKRLFEIIREANDLIQAEYLHDKFDEIMKIIDELRDYTEFHFRDEEAYMEQIGYPELPAQKRAHAVFEERLAEIDIFKMSEIDDNQQSYLLELIDFLLSWLSNHILKMDKKIGEYK